MPTFYEGIGLEELVDEVESVLRGNLNTALQEQDVFWAPRDEARSVMRGHDYIPITLEPVNPGSFHAGSIPSLVAEKDLPLEDYPYVAIVPNDTAPDPSDANEDQRRVMQNQISIHAIAKSSPTEGPEFAYRRACRMAEAIFATVLGHRSLKRKLMGLSNPVRVQVSEPFLFNPKGHGPDYFWQAAGTQYAIKNLTKAH